MSALNNLELKQFFLTFLVPDGVGRYKLKIDSTAVVPVQRTPSLLRINNAAGNIAAGSNSVCILNSGVANGTVLGTVILPGEEVEFNVMGGDTLGAIAYDATGTVFIITKIV